MRATFIQNLGIPKHKLCRAQSPSCSVQLQRIKCPQCLGEQHKRDAETTAFTMWINAPVTKNLRRWKAQHTMNHGLWVFFVNQGFNFVYKISGCNSAKKSISQLELPLQGILIPSFLPSLFNSVLSWIVLVTVVRWCCREAFFLGFFVISL